MSNDMVLVVDDSPDIRTIVSRLLEHQGWKTIEAASGFEAVQMARRYRPVLVVMDLNLPGMDGLEAVRQLRADPALEEVPILAVTAYAGAMTATMALRAGCQHVVFKPFNLKVFAEEVASLLVPRLQLTHALA